MGFELGYLRRVPGGGRAERALQQPDETCPPAPQRGQVSEIAEEPDRWRGLHHFLICFGGSLYATAASVRRPFLSNPSSTYMRCRAWVLQTLLAVACRTVSWSRLSLRPRMQQGFGVTPTSGWVWGPKPLRAGSVPRTLACSAPALGPAAGVCSRA